MLMGFAALTLTLASCQNDEGIVAESENPDVVQFSTNTSRAAINDLASMMASPVGFAVYGTTASSTTAWLPGVDGSATYHYSALNWNWTSGAPQWPTTANSYPVNFYAYYPVAAAGFTPTATASTALTGAFVIQTASSAQTDFLAGTVSTATKPQSGKLTMVFNHITSKIDYGVIAGLGMNVEVQSLVSSNLKNTATYDYMAGSWSAPTGSDTYVYYGTYYPTGTGGTSPIVTFKPLLGDEITAYPFYLLPHSNHQMLMPQTTLCWNKSTTVANAYIGAIYRISSLLNPNVVGYASAVNHPNYVLGDYTGPLFAKVGFPYASGNLQWDPAKGYTYNLLLGTLNATNGYYTDTFYYDENGNRTNFPIQSGKQVGDPVTDGTINFNVLVTPWADQLPVPVN